MCLNGPLALWAMKHSHLSFRQSCLHWSVLFVLCNVIKMCIQSKEFKTEYFLRQMKT